MPEPDFKISFDAYVSYPFAKFICKRIGFAWLTANMITIARIIPSILFIGCMLWSMYYPSLIFLILSIFFGVLDGTYARMYNQQSAYGAKLNHTMSLSLRYIGWSFVVYKIGYHIAGPILLAIVLNNNYFHYSFGIFTPKLSRFVNDNLILVTFMLYPVLWSALF
jgi:hypothetical protein